MIESIIISSITVLSGGIIYYYLGKRLVNSQKEEVKEEILDYLSSPEGQLSIQNLGQIFASGIAKGIGLGGKLRGGKTFGIPNELLYRLLDRYMVKKGDKAITEEPPSSSSDPFGSS